MGARLGADIDVCQEGYVVLNQKGISVNASVEAMLPSLIPKRLASRFSEARGNNSLTVFVHGQGDFLEEPVTDALTLVFKDDPGGGLVCPIEQVTIEQYQANLAATEPGWVKVED